MIQFAWHVHHDMLVEALTEPIESRIAYIRGYKPEHERETRLRLLKVVQGPLPDALVKAEQGYIKAEQEYNEKGKDYDKADQEWKRAGLEWGKAWQEGEKDIEALHAIECPACPWNGRTIFP